MAPEDSRCPRNSGERVCFYCGGSDIVSGLTVDQTADAGQIGLAYKAWRLLQGTERLYADMCPSCGTVLRLYVKHPNRDWIVNKEPARQET